MKRLIALLGICAAGIYSGVAQETEWFKLLKTNTVFSFGANAAGEIYLCGRANDKVHFGVEANMAGYYLAKLNKIGNLLWIKPLPRQCSFHVLPDGSGFLVSAGLKNFEWEDILLSAPNPAIFVLYLNKDAKPVWGKAIHCPEMPQQHKTALNQGKLFFHAASSTGMYLDREMLAAPTGQLRTIRFLIDNQGNISSLRTSMALLDPLADSTVTGISFDNQGNYYLIGLGTHRLLHDPLFNTNGWGYVAKLHANGTRLWSNTVVEKADKEGFIVENISTNDYGFLLAGKFENTITINSKTFGKTDHTSAYIAQCDHQGNVIWFKSGYSDLNLPTLFVAGSGNFAYGLGQINGASIFEGKRFVPNDKDSFLWSLNLKNPDEITLSGRISRITEKDCATPGVGLGGFRVIAEPEGIFSTTDEHGLYSLRVPKGSHIVSQIIPPSYRNFTRQYCPFESSIKVEAEVLGGEVKGLNFSNISKNAHHLSVSVSSNRRRRCFRNLTTVFFENTGNTTAEDVVVQLTLDKFTIPISSKPFWQAQNGNLLSYEIGSLKPGQKGVIYLTDSVICGDESIRGLIQCTRAEIFPANNSAFLASDLWDGSDLEIIGQCVNNRITALSIKNIGTGNMSDSTTYRLYIDDNLTIRRKIKLVKGDSQGIVVDAASATVRLEVDNTPYNPNRNTVVKFLLPCMGDGGRRTGTETQPFGYEDESSQISQECLSIVDSYDPNDKLASPKGWGTENCIQRGEKLRYKIRFQNTGTDTAYRVVISDTLDQSLDLDELKVLEGSHPFSWKLEGKAGLAVLKFTFEQINLPDSATDRLASQGFVHFEIQPKRDQPLGSQIRNSAAIYFDFNSPIITNQSIHTLCELPDPDSRFADRVGFGFLGQSETRLTCFPNPIGNQITIRLIRQGLGFEPVELWLWDMTGRLLDQIAIGEFLDSEIQKQYDTSALLSGIYLLELRVGGSGKGYFKLVKSE